MSSNPGSDIEQIIQSLERGRDEAQSTWQDGKAGEFESSMDSITAEAKNLQKALNQLEELIQSSEESFPLT